MSDDGGSSRGWHQYVRDMIQFGENVVSFTDGMDMAVFVEDARTYHAVLRNLELIGEAASHIPLGVRDAFPKIDWRRIVSFRNRLAHAYFRIDDDIVWDIVTKDIPSLLPQLRHLIETAGREDE
ncbi:MAG: DUF86 domain-containing protein [Rhodospirillaceae bacterium]|nr:DUF86 domain-containing protein [Rhodospirillaceae bacterium]